MLLCYEHSGVTTASLAKTLGIPKGQADKIPSLKGPLNLLAELFGISNKQIISQGQHGKTDYLLVSYSSLAVNDKNIPSTVELFSDLWSAVPRPDLEAALKQGADAPINVAIGLPKYMIETLKILKPSQKFDTGTVVEQGVRWASLTLDSDLTSLDLTIQSQSPEAAKALEKMIDELTVEAFKLIAEPPNKLTPQLFSATLKALLSPKISDSQLQYSLSLQPDGMVLKNLKMVFEPIQKRRSQNVCKNNMKQIGLAILNYESVNGHFPPAYTVDKNGKPLHSWRVLILPYLEQYSLYKKIKLDEPWDSKHNKQFHKEVIKVYQTGHDVPPGHTHYSVVVGTETAFPPDSKTIRFRDIRDGTSCTLMMAERAKSVCWMEPTDLSFEALLKDKPTQKLGKLHGGIGHFLSCDGAVHIFYKKPDRDTLKGVITINGREAVDFGKLEK